MIVKPAVAALAFALSSAALHGQTAAPVPATPSTGPDLATRNGFMDGTARPTATRTVTPPAGGFMASTPTPFKVPPVTRSAWADPSVVPPVLVRYPTPVLTHPPPPAGARPTAPQP